MGGVVGVVLAGGRGARLSPLSRRRAKPFMKLAGRRLYEYSLNELRYAGLRDVVVVTRAEWAGMVGGATVVVQEGEGVDAAFVAALRAAEKAGADAVLLSFTGFISSPPGLAAGVLEYYRSSGYPLVLGVVPVASGLETYGFVDLEAPDRVKLMKSPFDVAPGEGRPGYVFAGVLAASLESLREHAGFLEAVNSLARRGLAGAYVWSGEWVEIGYPWDLLLASEVVLGLLYPKLSPSASVARTAVLQGKVVVEDGAVVEENAVIVGPAYVGRGARVGAGAVLKGPVIVEDGASIEENSVVESSIVMEESAVGPLVVVEYSIVGEGARVGPLSALQGSEPTELPERLRGLVGLLGKKIRLGAIVAPGSEVPARSHLAGGVIVE